MLNRDSIQLSLDIILCSLQPFILPYEKRKRWILEKIDKWLLQQPEGISIEQFLLSKQNIASEPYSLAPKTISEGTEKPH